MNQLPGENSVSLPCVPEGYGFRHLPVHGYFADPGVGNSTLYHPPTYTQAVRVSSPYEQQQLRWFPPYLTIYQPTDINNNEMGNLMNLSTFTGSNEGLKKKTFSVDDILK